MRDWLTIDVLLALLLATSFTSVGLLSLCAATSTRHWFLRVATVFAVLSPLLVVPAYELFTAFAVECVVVAIGVLLYRGKYRPRHFSLTSLLAMTVVVAVSVIIATRLPRLDSLAWTTVALNGLTAGLATLAGTWCVVFPRKWLASSAGFLICVVAGIVMAHFDWLFLTFTRISDWPPDPSTMVMMYSSDNGRPVVAWFFIPLLVALSVALLTLRWRAVVCAGAGQPNENANGRASSHRRTTAVALFGLAAMFFAAFPTYVLVKLAAPDPIPTNTLPNPNGYDDLVAAGHIAQQSLFNNTSSTIDVERAFAQQLEAEIQKCAKAFDLVNTALEKPCAVPVNYSYTEGPLPFPEIGLHRSTARLLFAKGRFAELNVHFDDAAESYKQIVQFAHAVRHGGLLIDAIVGFACEQFGGRPLYHVREKLSPEELDRCINALRQFDVADEPCEAYLRRDRLWTRRTQGWHGHLGQILGDLLLPKYEVGFFRSEEYPISFRANQAWLRLLIVELAIERYRRDKHHPPISLTVLVPKYVAALPVDPFDPTSGPLTYRREDNNYVLYSLGANQSDDGGTPPDENSPLGALQTSDLRLDKFYAPESANAADANATDQEPGPEVLPEVFE